MLLTPPGLRRPRHTLLIGASSEIGRLLAAELARRGVHVSAASREPPSDLDFAAWATLAWPRPDWTALLAEIEAAAGAPIDAIVYLCGLGVFGQTVEIPERDAREGFEVNFWGGAGAAAAAAALWQRHATEGTFLAVLSVAARWATLYEAYYGAAKSALDRYLECLDLEHSAAGRRFVGVYLGLLRTPFRQRALWHGMLPTLADGQGADPAAAAAAVAQILCGERRRAVFGLREQIVDAVSRLLPGLYERLVLVRRVRDTRR